MYFSALTSLALLIPTCVTATGTLGFALGTQLPDGTCKSTTDYEADFDAIAKASTARLVRGYDANDCDTAQQILPAAKTKGFQVVLGIWPDLESTFNQGVNAIKQYMPGYQKQVYAITVGSETLYRKNFTATQLNAKISQVKQMFPDVKIGTADSWNKFADGTADAVITGGAADILMVNAFAYWQGQAITNASHTYFDDIMQAFSAIQAKNKNIELWNGEAGWPTTGGTDYEAAKASTPYARHFWQQGICGLLDWDVNVFYFEAFDEPQKTTSVGENGQPQDETHWGAFTTDRQAKFPLSC